MTPTDKDYFLFKSLQKQDENALKKLYDQYWKKMYVYALKVLNDQQLCEDIIQEIFISLWEKAASVKINNIESYLFKALKYKIVNALRDQKYVYINEEHLNLIPSENNVKNILEYKDLESQLNETINDLPEKCRNVFYLSRMENYSNVEIAKELNISIRTVETHISKALKHLRLHVSYIWIFLFLINSQL
ncbi:RNA polymerase sigma factor [Joostella sp. CR20]|uniref:RNA polymerase sigma factor n=1 Tax=Joostella sp. CR20 TaxID=2804312 RepID=UPI00313DDAF8